MLSPVCYRFLPILLLFFLADKAVSQILLNEVVSASSSRLLQWDAAGVPRVGTSTAWHQDGFDDSGWQSGAGPVGFGSFRGLSSGTNVGTQMIHLTPSLYLRKSFNVSASDAARTDDFELVVDYNDGFICYVNGVEVARRWAGAAKQFHFHDQPAYSPNLDATVLATTRPYSAVINLGAANEVLRAGENLVAIHALNIHVSNPTFFVATAFRITGSPEVNLIRSSESWKYLPGVVEPSAGVDDPTLLFSGRLKVPWATTSFEVPPAVVKGGSSKTR
jgi:hypothetical protein